MTTAQINKAYDTFIVSFSIKGNVRDEQRFGPFSKVKSKAIADLTEILNANYGRGEHIVTIYGALLQEQTPIEKMKLGFPSELQYVKDKQLFTL